MAQTEAMDDTRPPLLLLVTTADAERLRGALTIACAEMALGGTVRLFLQLDAVGLIAPPVVGPHDQTHAATGLPRLAALFDDALALGVEVLACQSGLPLAGITADDLDPRVVMSGPLDVLSRLDTRTRLLIA